LNTGTVIKSTGSWYSIKNADGITQCRIKGKFRIQGIKTTNPLAVGDVVDFEINKEDGTGVIKKIHERRNYVLRKSINLSHHSHIIAANIDMALLVVTLRTPVTYPAFIDRFLIACEAYKIPAVILFNKIDVYFEKEKEQLETYLEVYRKAGYPCYPMSIKENIGVSEIATLIKEKTIVISGNSGVGKSSLINALDPDRELKTGNTSDYHGKGKHTTTFAEMFPIAGGNIIDTPGIKGFGLPDMTKEEIAHYFPEMFRLLDSCKFGNCAHIHEPGCAVKSAIETGEVSEMRYKSYINIIDDDEGRFRTDIFR